MWTLDEGTRRRYVHGMTRLSVWYVRVLLEQGEIQAEAVAEALSTRVNLYRLTDLWDGVRDAADGRGDLAWEPLAADIAAWVRDTPMADVGGLEQRVEGLLEPLLERRLPKDVGPPPERPFGCWTYEMGWVGLSERPGLLGKLSNRAHVSALLRRRLGLAEQPSRHVVLHIMNVKAPRSPFENMAELGGTLLGLIAEIRERQPQVRTLWCNTWLNDHPKFREIFPEVWFRSAVLAPRGHFRNWWGQFARRDGDFNETTAAQFRASGGVFPFRALECHAPLGAVEDFLRGRYPRADSLDNKSGAA